MRDLVLLAALPFMLYAMSKRPFVGLGMWIWTALFFPNGWVFGIASGIRYNLLFTGMTLLAYMAMKPKPAFKLNGTAMLVLLFFAWTTLSSMTGIGLLERTWEIWNRFMKVIALFLFVLAIIENKLHVEFFFWCVVLSVGFYANLEALKFLASGGHHMIEGMNGHVLGDRNELAVAFVMILPICMYLLREYGPKSRLLSIGLLGTIALLVVSVVGTQSRGGFIALLALGGYFYMKSEKKALATVLIIVLAVGLSQVVSSEWVSRINTINAADKDASFMGRVVAWKLSLILASQHPLTGGGFKALEYFPVWSNLSKDFFSFSWFYTGDAAPSAERAHAAHSIFFQVLGDHGFVGLAIFLSILLATFRTARRIVRVSRQHNVPDWIPNVAKTLQLSMFGFCVGGAALSFAYFDLTYAIIGLLVVLNTRILPAAIAESKKSTPIPDLRT
jgi:probable O-glycosylation ligase (exosortase A-associated)